MPEPVTLNEKLGSIRVARNSIKSSLVAQGQEVGDDIRDYAPSINTMCTELEGLAIYILGQELSE